MRTVIYSTQNGAILHVLPTELDAETGQPRDYLAMPYQGHLHVEDDSAPLAPGVQMVARVDGVVRVVDVPAKTIGGK